MDSVSPLIVLNIADSGALKLTVIGSQAAVRMTSVALVARRDLAAVDQPRLLLALVVVTLLLHDASGTTRAGQPSGLVMWLHLKTSS